MSIVSPKQATKLLKVGQVVALPTETVYGLAGSIKNENTLKLIFTTKSRPLFDPLIVHVQSLTQAMDYGHWGEIAKKLAQYFWPGPLTIIVPKKENISPLISSGGPTVAFRQPNHPLFNEILNQLSTPLAAPSANLFGKTSPTCAEHVLNEFTNQVPVVDGGPSEKGIESTVVEVFEQKKEVRILRPGVIGKNDLNDFLKKESLGGSITQAQQENSPGFLKNHYQPSSPLILVKNPVLNVKEIEYLILKNIGLSAKEWTLPESAALAARSLYSDLRQFSKQNQAHYLIVKPQWLKEDLWQSILNRLQKACHGFIEQKQGVWTYSKK